MASRLPLIRTDWHQAVVGMTGSGKTTLLRRMMSFWGRWLESRAIPAYYHIYVLDTKHEGDFQGLGIHYDHLENLIEAPDQSSRLIVYDPAEDEDSELYYELFLAHIWSRQLRDPITGRTANIHVPSTIVVDELTSLELKTGLKSYLVETRGGRELHVWSRIMKRGRSAQVVLWNATQNPIYLPADFLRGASQIIDFYLQNQADRDRMATYMGDTVRANPPGAHAYWWWNIKHPQNTYYSANTL